MTIDPLLPSDVIGNAVSRMLPLSPATEPSDMPTRHRFLLLPLLLIANPEVTRAEDAPGPQQVNPTISPLMVAAGFLDSHPDLRFRTRGLEEYEDRKYPEAFREFQQAAYYSDKPSQAIVAEMLWIGLGTEKDRALAYIWMGLAAERGYTSFSEKHQRYWSELDEGERARALKLRPTLHAGYADAVAQERLDSILRRERKKVTGSRLGFTGNPVQIVVPGVGTLDSSEYYHPKYWDPKQYRALQDSMWQNARIGRVDVGEVEQVSNDKVPAQPTTPSEPL